MLTIMNFFFFVKGPYEGRNMGTIACVPEVDFSPKLLPELLLALEIII